MRTPHTDSLFDTFAVSLFVYFLFAGGGAYLPSCDAIQTPNVHQAGDSILPPEPEEPPPEDGRSVYDPEIYNKWQGLPFTDEIPSEPQDEEDEGPVMPSYPWRGGGHEPMPLSDPEEEKRKMEVKDSEVIIGFINCKGVQLDHFEDDWEALDQDTDKEEEESSKEGDAFEETPHDESLEEESYDGSDEICDEVSDDSSAMLEDSSDTNEVSSDTNKVSSDTNKVSSDTNEVSSDTNEDSSETNVDTSETNEDSKNTNEDTSVTDENFALLKSSSIFGVGANPDFVDIAPTDKHLLHRASLQHSGHFLPFQWSISKTIFPILKISRVKKKLHTHKCNFLLNNESPYTNYDVLQKRSPKDKKWNYRGGKNKSRVNRNGISNNFQQRTNSNRRNYFSRKENGSGDYVSSQTTIFNESNTIFPDVFFLNRDPPYVSYVQMQRSLIGPKLAKSRGAIRNYFLQQFRGVPVDEETEGDAPEAGGTGAAANVIDSEDEQSTGTAGIRTEDWDQQKRPSQIETQGELSYDMCEQCLPCCAYFFRREQDATGNLQFSIDDECKPDDRDLDNPSAECRTCHVRRRPAGQGVTLTCYECAGQQGDRGCRLGVRNPEMSQYRVSARFFVITSSNETTTTATQANSMQARRPYFFVPQDGIENVYEPEDLFEPEVEEEEDFTETQEKAVADVD